MPVAEALDALGLDWKRPPFRPTKSGNSLFLVYVPTDRGGCRAVEIVARGPRWYQRAARRGGCGAIDLAVQLLGLSFREAAGLLLPSPAAARS